MEAWSSPAAAHAVSARATERDAAPEAIPNKRLMSASSPRRVQRVLLRVRASVHVSVEGQAQTFDVATLSVHPRGALVVMNRNLPPETRVVLEHGATKECVACKALPASRGAQGAFHVPLEFDSPSPNFWGIAFPPADWQPDDV